MTFHEKLAEIAEQLKRGEQPEPVTVRAFLEWDNARRRGYWIVRLMRQALDRAGLITEPDFEGAYIDSKIEFRLKAETEIAHPNPAAPDGDALVAVVEEEHQQAPALPSYLTGGVQDPTYRIGKLAAANRPPLVVNAQTNVAELVTLMMLHDFSQIPVMQGERTVRGIVSWQSIGSRAAMGCLGTTAGDCMDEAAEISADASLFAALPTIVSKDYVLIRGAEQKITGIVTTSDLSLQFQQLAEPFLLIGEIENHIRRIIDGKFTPEEVKAACDPDNTEREVNSVADLMFGEYVRLLENPELWGKVGLQVDRSTFVKRLDRVREIRNDVMHFDPDGIAEEDYVTLRQFTSLLQNLQTIGAS